MSVGGETLYMKGDANVEVTSSAVTLGDIVKMECANPKVVPRLQGIKVLELPAKPESAYHGNSRVVVSALRLIECIHQVFPELVVQNLGEADIIVTFAKQETAEGPLHWMKVVLVVLVSFCGSAFSIMAFNNDIDSTRLFGHIYEFVTGHPSDGFTLLEVTYSVGIVIGILIFFNHFGRRRFSADPTPMEVEMRLYETDIQKTLVENSARKGNTIDVGESNHHSNHRT